MPQCRNLLWWSRSFSVRIGYPILSLPGSHPSAAPRVVYLNPADNGSQCLPLRLRRVQPAIICPQNGLSGPLPALLACLEADLSPAISRSCFSPALASAGGCGHGGTRQRSPSRQLQPGSVSPAALASVCGHHCVAEPSALVLYPKARPGWVMGSHRGAGGTLDKFKAARDGRLAHHGDLSKILGGNHVPAAIADRRIGLQPCAPGGRSWLVCNLASTTDRHSVLQEVEARPAKLATGWRRGSLCPCPTTTSIDGGSVPCHKGTVKVL